ncbi:hypothetical protein DPV95_01775 [Haemophilus parainfluenzae]|uniref:Uncharacterized protein n=1 Tax=Haemophilus parainfluenzae TaxID=729 RepID=A0AAQ0KD93_HAEPA|nr:hypothetical protein DPV95_01775 [Haemophilus parainfluenzae]
MQLKQISILEEPKPKGQFGDKTTSDIQKTGFIACFFYSLLFLQKKANVCAKSAVQYPPIFYSYN